jgi:hypothetical protein
LERFPSDEEGKGRLTLSSGWRCPEKAHGLISKAELIGLRKKVYLARSRGKQ